MTIRRRAKEKRVTIHEKALIWRLGAIHGRKAESSVPSARTKPFARGRMADPAHFDILSKGVLYWNDWRHAHPEAVPDLDGAGLSRMSLRDGDFRRASMKGAVLRKADLAVEAVRGDFLKQTRRGGLFQKTAPWNWLRAWIRKATAPGPWSRWRRIPGRGPKEISPPT